MQTLHAPKISSETFAAVKQPRHDAHDAVASFGRFGCSLDPLLELYEVIHAPCGSRRRVSTVEDRRGGARDVKAHGADGIVITGDHVVDRPWIVVGVHHAYHRNAELVGFGDGDLLVSDIDDEQGIG